MSVIAAVRSFVKEEEGIAVTEYGLLVALVAVALVVVTRTFGTDISSWFSARTGSITSA
jgi:Flp pilus assembly pilin Flp